MVEDEDGDSDPDACKHGAFVSAFTRDSLGGMSLLYDLSPREVLVVASVHPCCSMHKVRVSQGLTALEYHRRWHYAPHFFIGYKP